MPAHEPTPSIGAKVRDRRMARGLSLSRVAEVVGCAKSYLSAIENERRDRPPSEDLLLRLERALGFAQGELADVAQWQRMPDQVRREVAQLQSTRRSVDEAGRRLRDILARSALTADGQLEGGIDDAFRSGELAKLVERLSPEGAVADERESRSTVRGASLPMEVPVINAVRAGYPTEFTDLGYPARVADEYVRCPDVSDPDAFAARVVGDSMSPDYRESDIVVFSPSRSFVSGCDCFVRLEPDHETTFKRVFAEHDAAGRQVLRLQPINAAYPPKVVPREQVAGLYPAVSLVRAVSMPG